MRKSVKAAIGLLAVLVAVSLLLWRQAEPAVPILAYHRVIDDREQFSVSPQEFEQQMAWLAAQGYHTVSLAEMTNAFAGKSKLPDKAIVITFDDGYVDNAETALPILKKYGFTGTVFVVASAVGQPNFLTWEQILHIEQQGMEIGSHTLSHVALSQIPLTQVERELAESKRVLDYHLPAKVRFIAYPYGQYVPEIFPLLQQFGYSGGCTGKVGTNKKDTPRYELKRVNIPQPKYGLWEFRVRLWRAQFLGWLR